MNIHRNIAAILSIIIGTISLLGIIGVVLIVGGVAAVSNWGDDLPAFVVPIIASMGIFVAGIAGAFALADIIAGVYYLQGSSVAKGWLILSNLLMVFAFPIGTAIGVYSLWAILRTPKPPQVGHQGVPGLG